MCHDDDQSVSLITNDTKPRSFKREDAENIYLYVDMPGIDEVDVEATVEGLGDSNCLCIKGEALEKDYECECRNYIDSFDLPKNIKTTAIKAYMQNGVLNLTLPKVKEINRDDKMCHKLKIMVDSEDYY